MRSKSRNRCVRCGSVLVLAAGLGASAALFSVLDRILFRSLPYPNANRIVSFGISIKPFPTEFVPEPGYTEYLHPVPVPFESMATILSTGTPCDVTEQYPERLLCARVEANLLAVLKRPVLLGRDFTANDDRPGSPAVALISHGLWSRRLGRNPNIAKQSIRLDGRSVEIIGVLPPDFEMPLGKADILLPQQLASLNSKGTFTSFLLGIGRLKPGATIEQAGAVVQTRLEGRLQFLNPSMRQQARFVVRPLLSRQIGDAPRIAWLLLGAVATLLLIACLNVTNLLLARIAAQQHQYSIRSAIGAGKPRLVRLALIESLLLAIAGGAAGLLIAELLLKIFILMAPASIPKIQQASLDSRVFLIAAGLTLLSGILVGLWPAATVWRNHELRASRNTVGVKTRTRFILIAVQIALTITMLGGSALFLRSLRKLTSIPLGFETDRVIVLSATLNRSKYPKPDQGALFFDNLMERARSIPETLSSALSDTPPPIGITIILSHVEVDHQSFSKDEPGREIRQRTVTPQYFETFKIPIIKGRAFEASDGRSPEPAAILSEGAAKILFPGQNPIGRRMRPQSVYPWHVVVGIARDIRNMGLTGQPQPELYLVRSSSNNIFLWMPSTLAIRPSMQPNAAAALLKQAATDLDPELPVDIKTLDQQIASLSERPRFITCLLTAFATFALLLAASGLYGIASYLVSQQTREIGIRIALGASPTNLVRSVIGEAAIWIAAGVLLGAPLAWTGGRIIRSELFDVAPADVISWGFALLVLLIAVLIAVIRPAVHAVRINPNDALRVE